MLRVYEGCDIALSANLRGWKIQQRPSRAVFATFSANRRGENGPTDRTGKLLRFCVMIIQPRDGSLHIFLLVKI